MYVVPIDAHVLLSFFFFLGSLSYSLLTSSGVSVIFFFFSARSFSSVGHLSCGGGGTTDCFS